MTDEELYVGAQALQDAAKELGRDVSVVAYAIISAQEAQIQRLEQHGSGYHRRRSSGRFGEARHDAGTTDEWIATGRDYSDD